MYINNIITSYKNKSTKLSLFVIIAVFLFSCKTVDQTNISTEKPQVLNKDSVLFSQVSEKQEKINEYRETRQKVNSLIDMQLEVSFDWPMRRLYGKAELKLKPYFYPTDSLILDAKYMDLHKVSLKKGSQLIPLDFTYDSLQINLKLDKTYKNNEEYILIVEYNSKTYEFSQDRKSFLLDDRGLFFVNHDNSDKDKPQQIWTQGQTESNSFWFPTIDAPNQRYTHDIYITVNNKFKTLSNGTLVNTLLNQDTTRTDHWRMEKPHAPYLTMIAVGDFAVVKDSWHNIPLFYYVEPEYEPYAKDIFGRTPEMLNLLERLFGVEYPWNKYAQIIVQDYVSGAMENTTATVFGDFVQKTKEQLIDGNNDAIIMHELCHHWFGNLVTCESWANLTLNEAFATYSEYLWMEHKYGKNAADKYLSDMKNAYLSESRRTNKDLVRFYYDFRDDMFDLHSYNKGGLILHQLRGLVGDEAFFGALKLYLERHQFKAVEVQDLRLAFEEVTGLDLNWYFNQYFLSKGHPKLRISYEYNEITKQLVYSVQQTQNLRKTQLFKIKTSIDIYVNGKVINRPITISKQKQDFVFKLDKRPELVIFDSDKHLLCEKYEKKTTNECLFQFYNAPTFFDKYEAMNALVNMDTAKVQQLFIDALEIPELKVHAINNFYFKNWQNNESFQEKQALAVLKDKDSEVRSKALLKISSTNFKQKAKLLQKVIENEKSPKVLNTIFYSIHRLSPEEQLTIAENKNTQEKMPLLALSIFKRYGNDSKSLIFENNIQNITDNNKWTAVEMYTDYVLKFDYDVIAKSIDFFKKTAMEGKPWWIKGAATQALLKISEHCTEKGNKNAEGTINKYNELGKKIASDVDSIMHNEKNEELIEWYKEMSQKHSHVHEHD